MVELAVQRGFLTGLWLAGAVLAVPARALELVQGGYGTLPEAPARADAAPVGVDGLAGEPGLSLEFTPRASLSSWSADAADVDEPTLRFDLTVRSNASQPVRPLANGTSRDALRANAAPNQSSLTVGGAMRWSDWSVGGGLGRAHVLGEDVDLMSATLGYGPVRAEIAFGQSQATAGVPQDVLMFSTDLAAWSWLTLESNLALGSRSAPVDGARDRNRDSVASGRFGLRLNF